MGIRCAEHVTPSIRKKLALSSPTGGDRSVGIVRLRTKATERVWVSTRRPPAYEDRTDREFRNVGYQRYMDAGELPERQQITGRNMCANRRCSMKRQK